MSVAPMPGLMVSPRPCPPPTRLCARGPLSDTDSYRRGHRPLCGRPLYPRCAQCRLRQRRDGTHFKCHQRRGKCLHEPAVPHHFLRGPPHHRLVCDGGAGPKRRRGHHLVVDDRRLCGRRPALRAQRLRRHERGCAGQRARGAGRERRPAPRPQAGLQRGRRLRARRSWARAPRRVRLLLSVSRGVRSPQPGRAARRLCLWREPHQPVCPCGRWHLHEGGRRGRRPRRQSGGRHPGR